MQELRLHVCTLVVVTVAGIDALVTAEALVALISMDRIRSQWLASFEERNMVKAFGLVDATYREILDCFPLVLTGTFWRSKSEC